VPTDAELADEILNLGARLDLFEYCDDLLFLVALFFMPSWQVDPWIPCWQLPTAMK
jgi:hypothetical protein